MKDDLVGGLSLSIGLRMSSGHESGLAAEGTQIVYDLDSVKLEAIVEDHYIGDTKVSDDILLDEFMNFSRGDGGDDLSFYPLSKIVHCYKKVLALTHGFAERPKYVHAPSSKL